MSATVYVPHHQSGDYTYEAAEQYGPVKVVLDRSEQPIFNFRYMEGVIREGLGGFQETDFLLLAGNKFVVALAVAFLTARFETVQVLVWSKKFKRYEKYEMKREVWK